MFGILPSRLLTALNNWPKVFVSVTLKTHDLIGPRGYKTFFMLSATEHEIFLLINVKMPMIVGILTFMSWENSILGLSEPKKS